MIPEIGQLALILACLLALGQAVFPLVGAHKGWPRWTAVARPAAQGYFVFVLLAFGCLAASFLGNDFSVRYVAANSNTLLPAPYRFAAVWGGHEGSMLLWVLILGLWMLAVSVFSRQLPDALVARVLGVMGLIGASLVLFILATSNPFERLLPAALDGRDLNPLLQDPGMVFHPPLLYMGYVGFSVAFAFAIAALLAGQLDAAWARWSRPWTTVAWGFLSLGIALGSWWAYYELGWGGWWFWDPVENASFMPWLAGIALIHSLAVTEKRGDFRGWTVLLAILAFSLSLLGTFLVRSGVLSSVHAFVTDPERGGFILGFLALVIGGSLTLYAWRLPKVAVASRFAWLSREAVLLMNNVFLLAALGSVLLGTLYPLFLDALGLGKISVGPPYFNAVFVPLLAPVLFLMGVGPLARWKQASLPELAVRLRWALGVSAATALALPFLLGSWKPLVGLGLFLAVWIAASSLVVLRDRLWQPGAPWRTRLRRVPLGVHGMLLAHCGMAVCVAGITLVEGYETERDVRMRFGDTVVIAGYAFRFDSLEEIEGPNYVALRGSFQVSRDGRPHTRLHPEKRIYRASRMPMTEAAIDVGFTRDLYVSLGEAIDDATWVVRVYHKPFVDWIWAGFLFMALGSFVAVSDRRYRLLAQRAQAGLPAGGAALRA